MSGIFDLGMWEFDVGFVLTSLETARDLYRMEEGVTRHPGDDRGPVPGRGGRPRGPGGPAAGLPGPHLDGTEPHPVRRAAGGEEPDVHLLLIFITLVAAFGITNTLITMTVQKTREIGLLKALGFTPGSIMRVFIWQGWIQGFLGTVLGVGLGLLVLRYRNDLLRFLNTAFRLRTPAEGAVPPERDPGLYLAVRHSPGGGLGHDHLHPGRADPGLPGGPAGPGAGPAL